MDIRIHVAKNFPNDYIHQYCTQRNKLSALEIAVFGGVKMNAQDFSFTCTAVDMAFTCYMKALLDTPTLTDFCNDCLKERCLLLPLPSSVFCFKFRIYYLHWYTVQAHHPSSFGSQHYSRLSSSDIMFVGFERRPPQIVHKAFN
jgi:hypothetical protein